MTFKAMNRAIGKGRDRRGIMVNNHFGCEGDKAGTSVIYLYVAPGCLG